ncbi:MAG TPA: tetratricopeptide repeat protein [Streptosporangiaceae bacterium]|nr:tetratricopeptide repeat protein [Streptosporangiaceae bacterium]
MSGADITVHPSARPLLMAWQSAGQQERQEHLRGLPVPGPIALRGRYLHLRDPKAPPGPWDPAWQAATWDTVLRLETEGDEALRRNDVTAARTAFTTLLGMGLNESCAVAEVNARLGLGDAGLADENAEGASRDYEAALARATESGYRFGQLRALVGLGYMTLLFHSAAAALRLFTDAVALARDVGDLGYEANAELGAAECQERLGDLESAVRHAAEAHRVSEQIGSALGRGNAAQRLGAMLHRLGRPGEARTWMEQAHAAFVEADNPMGLTNVLSGLGDLLLDNDDPDGAERAYLQGLQMAEAAGLPRSRAHALQDLARVTLVRGDWDAAARQFETSLAAYREIDDLLGMSNASDKLARCHARLGRTDSALRVRMDAVFDVEEFRATHRDERSQREYRDRFAAAYAAALEAATTAGAAGAFAVVADCLAGRRLAGLFAETARAAAAPAGELALLQELLVRADQRLVGDRRARSAAAGVSPGDGFEETGQGDPRARRERVIRLLGAVGIRHGLADRAEASLDDVLAAVYLPPADEGDALLAALPDGCHALQLLLDPRDASLARWLWRDADGTARVGSTTLSAAAAGLITVLQVDGDERANLRLGDLAPLSELLPEPLRTALASGDGHRLILVPVGELWLVPWSAVQVAGRRVLGEAADYVVCPSLLVQRQLAARGAAPRGPGPRPAELWRSPFVRHHELARFQADPAWRVEPIGSSAQARDRLRDGSDTMVLTGHGRPAPGLGHYLELDQDEWLVPADLIGARPPRRMVLIACWGGGVPGRGPTDPLSLATLALAAGSAEILATVGELADSVLASLYVEQALAGLAGGSASAALHAATRWLLRDDGMRAEPIHHWAPLVPLGTHYGPDA